MKVPTRPQLIHLGATAVVSSLLTLFVKNFSDSTVGLLRSQL